ncbi:MAG: DUF5107 domain-containing protein, partial [Treponema sp.]|nr:DUF5107 domain-containing protein [Treponema sp.]
MSVSSSFLKISGSPLKGVNPQPFFRDLPFDLETARGDGFPPGKDANFGRETAFRVLPYSMQDRYDRELISLEIPSVILENNFLKAEILPSFGGRIWSLYDKINKRDLVYKNPVFRLCNLAIRDAWFSGGIEWNIGRLGHSVHTCSPVFAGLVKDGALQVLRLWEFERQTRLFWRVDLILFDDSPTLFAYVRIENPDAEKKPLYWWTNTAVPQTAGVRVFSAASDIICIVPGTGKTKTMGGAKLPALPTLPGADASFPAASTYSNEYFFQNDKACAGGKKTPWESAVYADGYAFAEASTAPLVYRKMFCWGAGRGGRRWQEFLSLPGEEYLEVQAGLAPTQLHTADIERRGVVDWVQGFGALPADADKARQKDYEAARSYIEGLLKKRIAAESLCAVLAKGRQLASVPPAEIMAQGTGWGCLEQSRPQGLLFPFSSVGAEELPWYELQQKGRLPARQSEEGPGAFLTDPLWAPLLEASLRHGSPPNDWLTP